MKHKGLIALAAIFAAGIVLTTFTSQILGVKEPVGTVMITNEADTEGVPMAGRAAAQAAIDEDPASQGQKTAAEEAGVAVYGLDAGADGASAPGGEAGDGTMSRKMAQDEAARPEMAMEESPDADGEAVSISPLDPEPALTGDSDGANIEMEQGILPITGTVWQNWKTGFRKTGKPRPHPTIVILPRHWQTVS